jgi:hypothetical protein
MLRHDVARRRASARPAMRPLLTSTSGPPPTCAPRGPSFLEATHGLSILGAHTHRMLLLARAPAFARVGRWSPSCAPMPHVFGSALSLCPLRHNVDVQPHAPLAAYKRVAHCLPARSSSSAITISAAAGEPLPPLSPVTDQHLQHLPHTTLKLYHTRVSPLCPAPRWSSSRSTRRHRAPPSPLADPFSAPTEPRNRPLGE